MGCAFITVDELRARVAKVSRLGDEARDAIGKAKLSTARVDEIRGGIEGIRNDLFEPESELRDLFLWDTASADQCLQLDEWSIELSKAVADAKKAGLKPPKQLEEELEHEKKDSEESFYDPLKDLAKRAGETLATILKWLLYGVLALVLVALAFVAWPKLVALQKAAS